MTASILRRQGLVSYNNTISTYRSLRAWEKRAEELSQAPVQVESNLLLIENQAGYSPEVVKTKPLDEGNIFVPIQESKVLGLTKDSREITPNQLSVAR